MPDTLVETVTVACEAFDSVGQPPELAPKPLLLSTEAARRLLSCGKTKLFELIRDRELEAVQIGTRRLIVTASVEQFVNRLRQSAQ